jgi:hypothetical protein
MMKHVLVVLVLVGASLFLMTDVADTNAQGKKPKGTIELLKSKDGKYRFNVRDADGKYLGGSAVGHATEKEAKEAVEELKMVLANATYVSKTADDGKDGKDK